MSWFNSKLNPWGEVVKKIKNREVVSVDLPGSTAELDKPKTPIEILQAEILILKFRLSLYERATGYSTRRAVEDRLNLHPELPLEEIERRIKYYEGI